MDFHLFFYFFQIPAYPWNKPYPGSPKLTNLETASGAEGDVLKTANIEMNKRIGQGIYDKAKVFKEELPRIGMEFRTDSGNKVAPVEAEEWVFFSEYLLLKVEPVEILNSKVGTR